MDFLFKGLVTMVIALLGTLLFMSVLAFGLDQRAMLDTDNDPPAAQAGSMHATSSVGSSPERAATGRP